MARPTKTKGVGKAATPKDGRDNAPTTLAERLIAEGERRGIERGKALIEAAIAKGRRDELRRTALRISSKGHSIERIAELLGLPEDEVRELMRDSPQDP